MQDYPKLSGFAVALGTVLLAIVSLSFLSYRRACSNVGYSLSADEFFKGVLYNTSNCGGNSSALSKCKMIVLSARVEADDHQGIFDYNSLPSDAQQEFARGSQSHWIPNAKFFIRRGPTDVRKKDG